MPNTWLTRARGFILAYAASLPVQIAHAQQDTLERDVTLVCDFSGVASYPTATLGLTPQRLIIEMKNEGLDVTYHVLSLGRQPEIPFGPDVTKDSDGVSLFVRQCRKNCLANVTPSTIYLMFEQQETSNVLAQIDRYTSRFSGTYARDLDDLTRRYVEEFDGPCSAQDIERQF